MVASPTVGQADDDPEVRTAGRPFIFSDNAPERNRRVSVMMSDEDREHLDQWAADHGVSRSTAGLLHIRRGLKAAGYDGITEIGADYRRLAESLILELESRIADDLAPADLWDATRQIAEQHGLRLRVKPRTR